MQIYKYMDIGTAKPTAAERAECLHHLIDFVEPDEDFSVAQYTELAHKAVSYTHLDVYKRQIDELASYSPKEILVNEAFSRAVAKQIEMSFGIKCERREELFEGGVSEVLSGQFGKQLDELGLSEKPETAFAAAGALRYIKYAQKASIEYINKLSVYSIKEYMELDYATRRNLEITETMRDKSKRGSLFWVLDKTKTAMGRRKLRQWMEKPLLNPIDINKRLMSVKELTDLSLIHIYLGI